MKKWRTTMRSTLSALLLSLGLMGALSLSACDDNDVGDELEEAAEEVEDEADDMTDER